VHNKRFPNPFVVSTLGLVDLWGCLWVGLESPDSAVDPLVKLTYNERNGAVEMEDGAGAKTDVSKNTFMSGPLQSAARGCRAAG
jgi:hypothetical protein